MVEMKRQMIIRELQDKGFTESQDGRLLMRLSLMELERERVRLPELSEVEA